MYFLFLLNANDENCVYLTIVILFSHESTKGKVANRPEQSRELSKIKVPN